MAKGLEIFHQRLKEILSFLKGGETDQATARLTFLTEDFALNFHQEAILLQGELRRIKKELIETGPSNDLRQLENQIAKRVLLLIKEIESTQFPQEQIAPMDNPSATMTRSHRLPLHHSSFPTPLDVSGDASIEKKQVIRGTKLMKKYDDFHLGPIDFELKQGEITSITGINGSGKSTILSMICGGVKQDSGDLLFDVGYDSDSWYDAKKHIGFLPQSFKYPPSINTRSLLIYTASMHGIPKSKINDLVNEYIIRLGLENESHKDLDELSQGNRLRFELARVLMVRPRILVLDEPLANLDFISRHALVNDLRNFTDSINFPMTTIVSSHNIEEIEVVADNFIVLDDGAVLFSGSKEEFNAVVQENMFEVITNVDASHFVTEMSSDFPDIKMFQLGVFQILFMPKSITLYSLLKVASDHKIEFLYTQELSKTTKSLIIINYIRKYGLEPVKISK